MVKERGGKECDVCRGKALKHIVRKSREGGCEGGQGSLGHEEVTKKMKEKFLVTKKKKNKEVSPRYAEIK